MADLSGPETFPTPTDAGEDVSAPVASDPIDSDLGSPSSVSGWPIYPGPPDSVTDGVPPTSAPSAPRHNGLWTAAVIGTVVAVAAAAVAIVAATIVPAPQAAIPITEPKVIAPTVWSPVDPSLTAGLVVVSGAAEADGIVMTPGGLVATSYSRINGDLHPPADWFGLRLAPDHQGVFPASITHADAAFDIAFLSATDFPPVPRRQAGNARPRRRRPDLARRPRRTPARRRHRRHRDRDRADLLPRRVEGPSHRLSVLAQRRYRRTGSCTRPR